MKKIAVIGAGYLQLPLVMKVKEMGHEVHCFAWEEGAVSKEIADYFYPISIIDKELILAVCSQLKVDGIVSIASDAAVPTVCYVAEKMGLLGNSFADALITTDKFLMRQCFIEHNVNSPKYSIAKEGLLYEDFQLPVIVKPTDRSGSRGVLKVERIEDLNNAIIRAQSESFSKQAIVEEYVAGDEVSVESITWEGIHYILAITDKTTTGKPYFVELAHHQPSMLSNTIQEKIKVETLKALTALNINYGASHSEFKIDKNGDVFAIEVGARMGGDFIGSNLVQLSTGYDFVKAAIDICLGNFEEPMITNDLCSGVYFLSEESIHILQIIENSKDYSYIVESKIVDEVITSIQSSADRSGYFIYQSNKKIIF